MLALRLFPRSGSNRRPSPLSRLASGAPPDHRRRQRHGLGYLCILLLLAVNGVVAAPRVLVVGDSISAAYGMSLEQGWVALLERQLAKRWQDVIFINASISGDTSAGGLRRLPQLLDEHEPDLVVLELGGNDGLRGYPTNKLRENLTDMATQARDVGSDVLILPMEIPPNYGSRYTKAFRAAFQSAAESSDATLGPFMLDGIATRSELMQADGIHPTVAAQPMIADLLRSTIETLLEQRPGF